jgi:hypothetical protein
MNFVNHAKNANSGEYIPDLVVVSGFLSGFRGPNILPGLPSKVSIKGSIPVIGRFVHVNS